MRMRIVMMSCLERTRVVTKKAAQSNKTTKIKMVKEQILKIK